MSYTRLTLNTPTFTETELVTLMNWQDGMGPHEGLQGLMNFFKGMTGGQYRGSIDAVTGATFGTATLTSTGTATAGQKVTIAGVDITAANSGPSTDEFVVSATPAVQAANIAAAINASAGLAGIVTASSSAGVTTITAAAVGEIGNTITITENLGNVSLVDFATSDTGGDGDSFSIDLS